MHRSGTSLLSGILQQLGVELPGRVIPGDEHNPDGYFEWDAVVALQERLLIDLDRWWPSASGVLSMPDGWLAHPASTHTYSKLYSLVSSSVVHQSGLWAIKDPRCSRLLPLWLQLCRELSIPLTILLAVRDPREVVTSLVHRDGSVAGIDSLRAQQLWWRHNLEAVQFAQRANIPLTVVDFDKWFSNPQQQLDSLLEALPSLLPSSLQRDRALSLIKPQYRRSNRSCNTFQVQGSIRRLHQRLLRHPLPRRWPSSLPPSPFFKAKSSLSLPSLYCPENWSSWVERRRFFPAPRLTKKIFMGADCHVSVCGYSWVDLFPHLLFQHAPLPNLGDFHVDFASSDLHNLHLFSNCEHSRQDSDPIVRIALNLELPSSDRSVQWLAHLQLQELIFDPEPARVLLLRALGLPAWWLDSEADANGWLQQPQAVDSRQWAARLGLTPPPHEQLLVLGPAGFGFERTLAQEMASSSEVMVDPRIPAISYWPGWPQLFVDNPSLGLLRAGWLQAAALSGARLICAGADHCPVEWDLLQTVSPCLAHPFDGTTAELRARHAGQPLIARAQERLTTPFLTMRHWTAPDLAQRPPLAAVVVSLYNYADRIVEALQSVSAQTQARLELIVVDDASTDDSTSVVERWIDGCLCLVGHPFVRVLLLRHRSNAGLAAARNTAFAQSQASWCFVLDADNVLFPDAIASCLALADPNDHKLAVVHPLLAVEAEPGRSDDQRTLVSPTCWQRERLLVGNEIDAMALVRRSAWETVGGYTHIEGGWEDYDFWCKLIEEGFHGLQCPRILAVYRSHPESMSHRATNRSWHALSRTLQQRHPWLKLPLAQSEDA